MCRKPRIKTPDPGETPHDPEALRTRNIESYPRLSGRLRQIAHIALDHPNDMALELAQAAQRSLATGQTVRMSTGR